jgi:DNA-binding MarR family transcriptional regulator
MKNTPSLEPIIAVISLLIARMETEAVKQEQFPELSMRQVYYLETILRMESPTFSDVAQSLGITKPSVTAIVEKLIQKGYVKKVQSGEDRRIFHITPTPKAEEFSRLHENTHRALAELFTKNLSKAEIEQLNSLLQKVLQNNKM